MRSVTDPGGYQEELKEDNGAKKQLAPAKY
jgi:hypothetical protein